MRTPNVPAAIEPAVNADHTERRYVYNGTYKKPVPASAPRSNRPVRPRKRSLFSIITMLLAISLLIVFYVWNKISVDRLANELINLDRTVERENGIITTLKSEISKKQDLERITNIAKQKLNLIEPNKQHIPIIIVDERLKQLQEE